ncbi:Extracellular glycosidase CRH11 [Smittium culicis]|uniref:Extracellular glycosidase CRH11 n=1 Tax=Smittium culicis TaxID=133412 RepID=A0A1R1XLT8_9FUNG|nr:Extracellular glycosidase CRH11 [Smittium culicis]
MYFSLPKASLTILTIALLATESIASTKRKCSRTGNTIKPKCKPVSKTAISTHLYSSITSSNTTPNPPPVYTTPPQYSTTTSTSSQAYLVPTTTSSTNPPVYTSHIVSSSTPPVVTSSIAPPVVTTSTAPPVATSSTAPPVATSSTAPPVATSSTAPPVATSSTAPPVVTSTAAPPVVTSSTESLQAPSTSNVPIQGVDFYDFANGSGLNDIVIDSCPQNAVVKDGSLQMTLDSVCGPIFSYRKKVVTGRVDIVIKMAPESGVVTAMNFLGNNLDEIDVEYVGVDPNRWQSMYFVRGQRVDQLAQFHNAVTPGGVGANLSTSFHSYSIEILENSINWYMDGSIVRTLVKTSADTFPSGAGDQFKFGVWNGGEIATTWAGPIDFSTGPKTAYMQSLKITHYT